MIIAALAIIGFGLLSLIVIGEGQFYSAHPEVPTATATKVYVTLWALCLVALVPSLDALLG